MANNRSTYQQQTNVSINKDMLRVIGANDNLSELDLRVLFMLFSELNGYKRPNNTSGKQEKDPLNYKKLDIEAIAMALDVKKKKVKKSIESLIDEDLVEIGSSDTVTNGYRFTF